MKPERLAPPNCRVRLSRSVVALLGAVGRAFREVGDFAGRDPLALAVVLLAGAFKAHADLIEIVLVARHVDLALLAHEVETEVVERAILAGQQRLELPLLTGPCAGDLRRVFGMGNLHGCILLLDRSGLLRAGREL